VSGLSDMSTAAVGLSTSSGSFSEGGLGCVQGYPDILDLVPRDSVDQLSEEDYWATPTTAAVMFSDASRKVR